MKIIFTFLLTSCLTFYINIVEAQQAPLNMKFVTSDSTSVVNGLIDVDVRVSDFQDIIATQFTILWDSLVLEIVDIPFISQDLNGLNIAAFSLPEQTTLGTKGRLRHAWVPSDAQAKSLPDDHLLFTMRFKAVGPQCSNTSFELLKTEIYETEVLADNGGFINIGANYNHLPILITGNNCSGFLEILACNNLVNVSLSPFGGITTLTPDMILEGGPYDYSIMEISPQSVDCSDMDTEVEVEVTNTNNGTKCWGNVAVDDKTGPIVILDNLTTVNLTFSTSSNPLIVKVFVETVDDGTYDNCSTKNELVFEPEFFEFDCTQLGPQEVTVIVTDASGNTNSAVTTINVELKEAIQMACPPNIVVDCGTAINDPNIISNILGMASSSTGCIPLYEDFQGYDQNQDGDMDDEYFINGVKVQESYEEACEFGSISRVWEIPGSTTACRQIIGLNNTGSTFDPTTMIDWPYSLNAIVEISDNDAGACTAACEAVDASNIELIYDNNGNPIGANVVVDCQDALCEEPFWESSSCSLIGWASEIIILDEQPGVTTLQKIYYVLDVCQYDENTGEGRWSWTVNATVNTGFANAVKFIIPDVTEERGEMVCLPVRVENFENIESLQGSINWNPAIAQFRSIGAFGLPGLTNGSFGLSSTDQGKLSFLWFDNTTTTPATLADGATVFELCFDVIGTMGSSTIVEMSNDPTVIEITSSSLLVPFSIENGSLFVGQSSCMNDLTAPTPYCINGLTVELINGEIELFALDFDAGSFDNCTDAGELRFSFSDVLPTDDPDFSGTSSSITLTSDDIPSDGSSLSMAVYVWDENDNSDFCSVSVMLQEDPNDLLTVEFSMDDFYGARGSSVCIPLRVNNFTNVQTAQGSIIWDPSVLSFTSIQNFNLPEFSEAANTNQNNVDLGKLTFVWFDMTGQNPIDLANNSSLFELCFDLSGEEGDVSLVELVSSPTLIQVSSPGFGNRPYVVDNGSVSILDSSCNFLESDITWPTMNLEVFVQGLNENNISTFLSPNSLLLLNGIDSSDVFPVVQLQSNCQNLVGVAYEDQVFVDGNGLFRIIRTWTLLDWLTLNTYSFSQTITNVSDIGFICDFLSNSAPVGDCSSGHSLEDDVEWPDDLDLNDHRISPDELSNSLGIEYGDTRPIFFNTPTAYSASYIDFLGELSQTSLEIEREWKVTRNNVAGLEWYYTQFISIDLTNFGKLVTVNTDKYRPVPGVVLNSSASTNEEGRAYTEESISPERLDDSRNGLNIRDMMLLRAWVLGQSTFSSFEQLAADINEDQVVSTLDIVEMEKIILSFDSPLSKEWKFVDQTVETSAGFAPKAHYIAYKPGDIDDSSDLGQTSIQLLSDTLVIQDQLLNAGETYQIPMFITGNVEALATELHLIFDENMVEITDVTSDQSFEQISFNIINGNRISMVTKNDQLNSMILDSETAFLTLEIEALQNGTLKNVFGLSELYDSYILDNNFELILIEDLFEGEISTSTKELAIADYFNVYPNPTTDLVRFVLKNGIGNGSLYFELFTIEGQRVIQTKDANEVSLINLPSGTYIYKLWNESGVQTGRVLKVD